MFITNEDADEKVRRYVLWRYKTFDKDEYHQPQHLHECSSTRVTDLDAHDKPPLT